MDSPAVRDILRRLKELERTTVRYRQGQIVDASAMSVSLGGSDTTYDGVAALGSADLADGDTVAALTFGNDMLVLGGISGGATAARAFFSTGGPIVGAGRTTLLLNAESFDPGNNYAASQYVCPASGYYAVNGRVRVELNNNPQEYCAFILKNTVPVTSGSLDTVRGGSSADDLASVISDIIECAAGDSLQLAVLNAGGNDVQIVGGDSTETWMSVVRVG